MNNENASALVGRTLHRLDVSGNQLPEVANYAGLDRDVRATAEHALICAEAVMADAKLSAIGKAAKLEEIDARFGAEMAAMGGKLDECHWSADVLAANLDRLDLPEVSPVQEARLAETRAVLRGLPMQDLLTEIREAEREKDQAALRAIVDSPRIARFGADREDDRKARAEAKAALARLMHPEHAGILHRVGDARTRAGRNLTLARGLVARQVRRHREILGL